MSPTLLDRVRARTSTVQQGEQDAGFVLIYVLMIITIVTVLVGSVLIVTASSVIPAQQAAYDQAAQAAAQAGIQDLMARANSACTGNNSTVAACVPLLPASLQNTWIPITQPTAGYTAQFKWSYAATTANANLRVTSSGKVIQGGVTATKTLIADLAGGTSTSCFDYASCTQYETQAPDVMSQLFPNRTIQLDSTYLAKADAAPGATGSSVSWSGPATTGAAGSVNVCNTTYLGASGREANPAPNRSSSFVDWFETGSVGSTAVSDYQPCQVSLGSSTKLVAPASSTNGVGGYTTNDALLLSNSNPGSTGGPLLNQPIFTTYSGATDPTGTAGQNYRSFTLPGYNPQVGGTPAGASTYATPTNVSAVPGAITSAPTVPANSCVYQGPTRIRLNSDGTATITSPQTTTILASSPSGCYPSSLGAGIYGWTSGVLSSITGFSGVISVRNSGSAPYTSPPAQNTPYTSTGWKAVNTRQAVGSSNSVFFNSIPAAGPSSVFSYTASAADKPYAPAIGDNPSTKTDVAWSPAWTSYTPGTTCNSSTAGTDVKLFNCSVNSGTYLATAYSTFKSTVQSALSATPGSYATASALQTYLNTLLAVGKSSDAGNSTPTNLDSRSHRWTATVTSSASNAGCTASPGSPVPSSATLNAPMKGDTFFQNSDGTSSTSVQTATTCLVAAITLQVGTCSLALVLGACVGTPVWGSGSPLLGAGGSLAQFTVTATVNTTTTTTSNTAATSQFPTAGDISTYGIGSTSATGPGDLYVEGTAATSLALIAANDVVVTNGLAPASPTTKGLQVVAQDNVRVYHPVSCLSSAVPGLVSSTNVGFCPNDLTGLYTAIPTDGYRPYQQYTNLRTDLTGTTVNAAVFALGRQAQTTDGLCPAWSSTGICGGEFTVDNYNRGTSLGTLAVVGTLFQEHHGAVGEEWEVADTAGQTRPNSGYDLSLQYQNLKSQLNGFTSLVATSTTIASLWHVVSTSATS